jgi:Ca2+-binding RTX toxin-like protein
MTGALRIGVLGACAAALLLGAETAAAKPGDLIAGDASGSQVLRINPSTGDASVVSADADLSDPSGIAFGPRGDLFTADYDGGPNDGTIFRIPRGSNSASVFADDLLAQPIAVERHPNGFLYAPDFQQQSVFEINAKTGNVDLFSDDSRVDDAIPIDAAANGDLYVGNEDPGAIIALDPRSGAIRTVASGGFLDSPYSIDVAPDGTLFVVDDDTGSVFAINPKTGEQSLLAVAGELMLTDPLVAAVHPNGLLYVADFDNDRIISIDPETEDQELVSDDPLIEGIEGIEVEPPKCKGRVANIVGSDKKDKLKGSRFPDVIAGLGGKDKIKGVKGNDRLCGGKGKDKLKGGPGKDKLLGQAGKDKLDGGPGKDKERQ